MIQLSSGTQTAGLTAASFCTCKQQPETWEYPLQLLTKWKDPPSSFSSSSHYANHHLLCQSSFCDWDAICSWMGNFWLPRWAQFQQQLPGLTYTCCCCWFGRLGLTLLQNPLQTEDRKMKSWCSFIKGIIAEHCSVQNLPAHLTVSYPSSCSASPPFLIYVTVLLLRNAEASPWHNPNSLCSHNALVIF